MPAVGVATGTVVMVKVARVEPAGMITVAGIVAAVLAVDKETVAPPGGASPFNVTVAVEDAPPNTEAGLKPIVDKQPGLQSGLRSL